LSGRGLCDELITRPEESYRLCCVVVCDLETSRMGAPYIYDISHLRVNTITTFPASTPRHVFHHNVSYLRSKCRMGDFPPSSNIHINMSPPSVNDKTCQHMHMPCNMALFIYSNYAFHTQLWFDITKDDLAFVQDSIFNFFWLEVSHFM